MAAAATRAIHVHAAEPKAAGRDTWAEQVDEPYIAALGTVNRDYALLAEAAGRLGYKTIIVAAPHASAHLPAPCVSFRSSMLVAPR